MAKALDQATAINLFLKDFYTSTRPDQNLNLVKYLREEQTGNYANRWKGLLAAVRAGGFFGAN